MRPQQVIIIPRVDLFFTCWAILAHLLSVCSVFYNTTALAIFVCVMSEIVNITINKEFNLIYHLTAHYLPLIIVLITMPFQLDVLPILILVLLYFVYYRYDIASILKNYERPSTVAFGQGIKINI